MKFHKEQWVNKITSVNLKSFHVECDIISYCPEICFFSINTDRIHEEYVMTVLKWIPGIWNLLVNHKFLWVQLEWPVHIPAVCHLFLLQENQGMSWNNSNVNNIIMGQNSSTFKQNLGKALWVEYAFRPFKINCAVWVRHTENNVEISLAWSQSQQDFVRVHLEQAYYAGNAVEDAPVLKTTCGLKFWTHVNLADETKK